MANKAAVREGKEKRTDKPEQSNLPVELKFSVPKVGQNLLVELPGERMMAEVVKVMSPEVVIVELTDIPLAKSHRYQKGDFIPCRSVYNGLENIWQAFIPKPSKGQ